MTAFAIWALGLAVGCAAIGSAVVTGPSNLTVGLALWATGTVLLALFIDEPPRGRDGRPW